MAGLSELARYGFTDLSGTLGKLDQLVNLIGDNGRAALASLAKSANPDQALNYLLTLAEIDKAKIKKLLNKEDSATRLCLLLGASEALADLLRRKPEFLSHFDKPVSTLKSSSELNLSLYNSVADQLAKDFQTAEIWSALRIKYREELLQVAIFDLTQSDVEFGVPAVAAALADLAGAALEAGIAIARAELKQSAEFGAFTPEEVDHTKLAVLAMGKCGARELNYISDVDVIFVGESSGADLSADRAVEIATKLATRMMRAMDGNAPEAMLWQVDPNLRPEGKSGALVRTLDSHVAYYDRWAQSWEFQALLKARPVAGDLDLGQRYVSALSPKVWSSASRDNFVESAQKMRERVMEHIPSNEVDLQIKLGPGGLRDIEFTVQLLQLVHGRTDETLRHRDTMGAINALASGGYIGRSEASAFASNYRFLRLLEHRIQMSQMRRTHLMPTSETARRSLARSINPKDNAESLTARWESVKLEVRGLHQRLFYRPLLSAVAKLEDSTLELTSAQAQDRLAAIGFTDPKGALAQIAALTNGLSRRAAIQRQLLPVLLQWFSQGTDPDSALLAFRRLSEDLGESPWYLRMLRDSSGAAERMTQVLGNSKLATSLFERMPEAAAWFENPAELQPVSADEIRIELDAIASRHEDSETTASAIRHVRRRETLRLALGAVLGDLDIEQVSKGLSDITEVYLQAMLNLVIESLDADVDFGIIAMGRFGGEELGFGSDADVMFTYDSRSGADPETLQKQSEKIVAELKRLTADNLLEFEIDNDLRPEGKNGVTVRSIDSYLAYYERWANTWEAQALLRARVIAGSENLRSAFIEIIDKYRYPRVLEQGAITEIRRIKARVESERLPQGADPKRHMKLGRGSLSDVEWLVQLYQLKFGADNPAIRTPRTLDALRAMVSCNLIEEHDARVLSEAWILASRVRSASVLWANKRTDVLPTDRRQLEGLARILEYPAHSASQLEEDYLSYTRRSRMVFERLFFA